MRTAQNILDHIENVQKSAVQELIEVVKTKTDDLDLLVTKFREARVSNKFLEWIILTVEAQTRLEQAQAEADAAKVHNERVNEQIAQLQQKIREIQLNHSPLVLKANTALLNEPNVQLAQLRKQIRSIDTSLVDVCRREAEAKNRAFPWINDPDFPLPIGRRVEEHWRDVIKSAEHEMTRRDRSEGQPQIQAEAKKALAERMLQQVKLTM